MKNKLRLKENCFKRHVDLIDYCGFIAFFNGLALIKFPVIKSNLFPVNAQRPQDILDHNMTKIICVKFFFYFVSTMSDLQLETENAKIALKIHNTDGL